MLHRKALARAGASAALAASLLVAPAAHAQGRGEVNSERLRRAVTVSGMLAHERAFQTIANANGGTRASGTPGFDASATYVKRRLERAGYRVTEQEFDFPFFRTLAPGELERLGPSPRAYVNETDFDTGDYSGSGEATGRVVPVDVLVPPGPTASSSTSGCEASDFADFPTGAIALVQRGTCTFEIKAANAQQAGAAAVIVFNEGQPGRTALLAGTLGRPFTLPVLFTSFAVGEELVNLARGGDVTVRVETTTESETRTTRNVLADTGRGETSQTVVVGGHLDSVVEGPGINDNGSGTSAILEIAEEMAELEVRPRRAVRFAFWGAEEKGLLGSEHYVDQLGPDGVADLYANLNFDMLASPNFARFVYDGDNSAFPVGPAAAAGPPGSGEIEAIFTRHFEGEGLASEPTAFSGRSDYGPFIAVGVPAGGLFSGAEGVKTEEQARLYGGTAGLAYDPNYHQVGDTINNLNTRGFGELADGAAHATLTLATRRRGLYDEEDVPRAAAQRTRLTFDGAHAVR